VAEKVFSNNASSLLAASIDDNDTVVQVDSGAGALFPSPGAGQHFVAALVNASGDLEIVNCTSRTGDLITVVRGQEGTAAQAWTNGVTRFELRLTAGVMDDLLQKTGDAMTGDLLMGGNEIQDARLTEDTVMVGGQTVGTAIRGAEDDASNEIAVPGDGSRATAGGSPLVTLADNLLTLLPIGFIGMWYGSLGSLPAGWQNCDGTNGSPDMRGFFPRGAGGSLALGATGGAATASGNTDAAGGHSHTVTVDGHALTTAELPAISPRVLDRGGGSGVADGSGLTACQSLAGIRNVAEGSYVTNNSLGTPFIEPLGGGNAHDHSAASNAVGNHTHGLGSISTIPPYKAVYFIMKVS
jgi:hypothetical protein